MARKHNNGMNLHAELVIKLSQQRIELLRQRTQLIQDQREVRKQIYNITQEMGELDDKVAEQLAKYEKYREGEKDEEEPAENSDGA